LEYINFSSTGGILLYLQHMVFIMHLRWLAASTIRDTICCIYSKIPPDDE